jgi:hypothetical protein
MEPGRRSFNLTELADGQLLASGGIGSSGNTLATLQIWDPRREQWVKQQSSLDVPRAYHSATLLEDGSVLLIGGLTGDVAEGNAVTATIERFDPTTDTVTQQGMLERGRWAHTATLLRDGRVLVAGGYRVNKYGSPSDVVEQLLVVEGLVVEISRIGNLNEPRAGHTASLLPSGMLVLTGGVSGATVSDTAEVFAY